MDLDTFHNHADTLPSGFKALTEKDLDRIDRERSRAHRKRSVIIGLVAVLVFLGCLAGTGYASSALSGGSAPAPTVHHNAPARIAPAKRVAPSKATPKPVVPAAPGAPAPQGSLPALTVGGYSGTEPQMIDFSGDGGNVVNSISWQYWNNTGAYGVGTSEIQSCVPDCADGSHTTVTTTITLSDVVDGNFQQITESRNGRTSTAMSSDAGWPLGAQQYDNSTQTSQYGQYLDALAAVGITAPSDWAIQTAQNLEAAWADGETEDQTNNQYLLPGGIYPQHLADFNAIVHQYFG